MSGNLEANQSLYRALLHATPDLVLLIEHDRILGVAPGGFSWVDSTALKQFTLVELLTESDYQQWDASRTAALAAPGQRVDMEVWISPEQQSNWAQAGLQKPGYFQLRLVAMENQQLVCVIRDLTPLRVLEKQRSSDVMRDPLTGLRSHRSLMPVLEKALGDSRRFEGTTFSLIIIDIDRFSDINDAYGWDAGDQVLRDVGAMLEEQKRSSDYLCRYGSDLFAMLLTETRADQAVGAGHRIQELCRSLSFEFTSDPINLTLSIGVATYNDSIEKPQELIQEAQDNLLIAISAGGDQVAGPV